MFNNQLLNKISKIFESFKNVKKISSFIPNIQPNKPEERKITQMIIFLFLKKLGFPSRYFLKTHQINLICMLKQMNIYKQIIFNAAESFTRSHTPYSE